MRIGALSRTADVPVATIKYYLRERLLPPGRATAANQAEYDETHVHRLRLIRALREVGGLGIEPIRRVMAAIDADDVSRHQLFGVAQGALEEPGPAHHPRGVTTADRREVDRFLRALGWHVRRDAAARRELTDALVALRRLRPDASVELFAPYAAAADAMARREVATIPPAASRPEALESMVVGTVIFERVFAALRRLAHEHHSADGFGRRPRLRPPPRRF